LCRSSAAEDSQLAAKRRYNEATMRAKRDPTVTRLSPCGITRAARFKNFVNGSPQQQSVSRYLDEIIYHTQDVLSKQRQRTLSGMILGKHQRHKKYRITAAKITRHSIVYRSQWNLAAFAQLMTLNLNVRIIRRISVM
jgi:hypothetical protein